MTSTRTRSTRPLSTADLATELAARTRGEVVPGADGSALPAVTPFNLATEHRPELVLLAADAEDVAAVVGLAAAAGRRIAVQATGHGAPAAGPDTVLVSTRALDGVVVDPTARIATVGAGATWQQVLDAAAPHGLAALAGSAPGVSAVGYTVGGGLGPVARTFGLAADHVRGFQVVTADGELVDVDAAHDPDRFWALRGGGAAFGVVTRMTIDLFPVATLYAGGLWFSADVARTVLHRWREWAAGLPEAVSTSVARLELPPAPALPPPLRGRSVVHVRIAHVGDPAEGARLAEPMRTVATPLLEDLGEMPYAALGAVHADPVDPMPVAERGLLLRDLPVDAVEAFADATAPGRSPIMMAELRLMGGAIGRPAAVPNAAGGRSAALSLHVVGVLAPPIAAVVPAAIDDVLERMAPWSTGGSLLAFAGSGGPVADARIRAAFGPEAWERLVALREATDPDAVLAPAARWTADAAPTAAAGGVS
ncbi:FAD-binding oxidoreductase [Geodermatophilus sabuli]|uniref:FAD-binding oxidoreductase n=1 Tax=Geodermatophilus sabuli TaxID=1564158 RepID=A0A7K3W844_9ACTN|nr:FAD-binding oxidoreductase [Geodermatophilus sabuli]NEK60037.1 FAD-binding oxidoreductase [Geodermatophilus sabuli]